MTEIDFITAFARLLRDGKLRKVFAANPEAAARQVHLREADLPSWMQLIPADVEFQADVLLRKRLDLVKLFTPETCRRLGEKLWPTFRSFARENWPPENAANFFDAYQFCERLKQQQSGSVVAVEWNRLRFAFSKCRLAFHSVRMPDARRRTRRGLQFFLRGRGCQWGEYFFYVSW